MHTFNKVISQGLLMLAAGLLTACGGDDPVIQMIEEDFLNNVIFTFERESIDRSTLSLRKTLGPVQVPGFEEPNTHVVISNASDWSTFWLDYTSSFSHPLPLPQVDFNQDRVLIAQRQTTCNTLDRIVYATVTGTNWRFTVIRGEKTDIPTLLTECGQAQEELRMVHIIKFNGISGTVDLIDWQATQ